MCLFGEKAVVLLANNGWLSFEAGVLIPQVDIKSDSLCLQKVPIREFTAMVLIVVWTWVLRLGRVVSDWVLPHLAEYLGVGNHTTTTWKSNFRGSGAPFGLLRTHDSVCTYPSSIHTHVPSHTNIHNEKQNEGQDIMARAFNPSFRRKN